MIRIVSFKVDPLLVDQKIHVYQCSIIFPKIVPTLSSSGLAVELKEKIIPFNVGLIENLFFYI